MRQLLDNSSDFNVITRKKKGVISCYIYPLYPFENLGIYILFCVLLYGDECFYLVYVGSLFEWPFKIYTLIYLLKKRRRVCCMVTIS